MQMRHRESECDVEEEEEAESLVSRSLSLLCRHLLFNPLDGFVQQLSQVPLRE